MQIRVVKNYKKIEKKPRAERNKKKISLTIKLILINNLITENYDKK